MKYIIGLFISVVGFVLASNHLHQGLSAYWDFVAFAVVLLGTLAIMLITFPAAPFGLLFKQFYLKFLFSSPSLQKHVDRCLQVFQTKKFHGKADSIEDKLLKDGLEMLALGFSTDRIEDVLSRRFETYSKRINMLSAWFKRGSKYPPAFGLAGTVLGLIHLMRGISEGIDTKETGVRMAVALVATFYGLLISNLVLNPIGEWLQEDIKRDEMKAEASLQLINLLATGANLVEASETMNSFLGQNERPSVNLLGTAAGSEDAA
jgi:chemotaxis protein MotA